MDYKNKYKKYKLKFINEKKKIADILIKYISLHIDNLSNKKFNIIPNDKILNYKLSSIFNGNGDDVSIINPSWGDDYNKKNKFLNKNVEDKIMSMINNQITKSIWCLVLLPFNFNFNKIVSLYKINKLHFHKNGNLITVIIQTNIPFENNMPSFKLKNLKNKMISNKQYEVNEQALLYKYLDKNDSVLQLGGNIGTSCILVDKIINGNNICVEPNTGLIPLLKNNKELNNSKFVIIDGIISKKKNMMLVESNDENKYGSFISKTKGKIVKNYDYNELNKKYNFTVLFADCEGCLEQFFEEYPNSLNTLNKIIFERDRGDNCDYEKVINILIKNNFKYQEGDFHQVYLKK